jgi:hypothetical protein
MSELAVLFNLDGHRIGELLVPDGQYSVARPQMVRASIGFSEDVPSLEPLRQTRSFVRRIMLPPSDEEFVQQYLGLGYRPTKRFAYIEAE